MMQHGRSVAAGQPASLAILAGGRAARLGGVAKGHLHRGGRSILDRLIELGSLFDEVLLVGVPATEVPAPCRRISDHLAGAGAPGGVHAALSGSRSAWVVAVGWDMPFITAPAVELLLSGRAPGAQAVCFRVGGRLQPLLAAYHRDLAPTFAAKMDRPPALTALLEAASPVIIPEELLARVDPELRCVRSLNTQEEAARFGFELP